VGGGFYYYLKVVRAMSLAVQFRCRLGPVNLLSRIAIHCADYRDNLGGVSRATLEVVLKR